MSTTFDHDFYPGDLAGLEFLTLLEEVAGDLTVGDAAAAGEYNAATAATLSDMHTEAVAFWATGIADTATATAITGLSTTTPRSYFDAFRSDAAAAGIWQGSGSDGRAWAVALRALGTSSTQAAAIYAWLMTFTSSTTYEDDDASEMEVAQGRTGEYDPTLALATTLDTDEEENTSSYYDWATAGLLGAFHAAAGRVKTIKEAMAKLRVRQGAAFTYGQPIFDCLPLLGTSGLTYQTGYTDVAARTWDAEAAAMFGNLYRQVPRSSPEVRP